MFSIDDFNISITRGDTATIEMVFSGDVPDETDTVVMSLKRNTNTKEILWEKHGKCMDGKALFDIESKDTSKLAFGSYLWDIRIFYHDGQITTPFKPKIFKVLEVVTNDR